MTKTQARNEIRKLRSQRKATLLGACLPWGVPWCAGPGAPYHQPPACEGCAVRAFCSDQAARLASEALEALLTPPAVPVQGVLFA